MSFRKLKLDFVHNPLVKTGNFAIAKCNRYFVDGSVHKKGESIKIDQNNIDYFRFNSHDYDFAEMKEI